MALSREKKESTIDKVSMLLSTSKMTVFAAYGGTSVKSMQDLRSQARASGSVVKVIKNRLVKKAIAGNDSLKSIDTSTLRGQLLYVFNPEDEVAPAQNLAAFARENPQLEFVGAITGDGQLLSVGDVKSLAALPTKDQLRGQLVGMLNSPTAGFVNVVAANVRGVLNVLNARAENLGN